MALTVGELAVGIDTSSLTELRREIEKTLVRAVQTRATPALKALRKLLMSAVRTALKTVATVIKTRLLRQVLAMGQMLSRAAGPILLISRLIRSFLIPALLALARDVAYAGAVMAITMATTAMVVAGWITVLAFSFATLAAVALAGAAAMALAWQLATQPIPLLVAAILELTAIVLLSWQNLVIWTVTSFAAIALTIISTWELVLGSTVLTWAAITVAVQTALALITISILTAWQAVLASTMVTFTTMWTFLQVIWAAITATIFLATAMIYANVAATWLSVVAVTLTAFTLILAIVSTLLAAILGVVIAYLSAIAQSFLTLRVLPDIVRAIFLLVYDIVDAILGALADRVRSRVDEIVAGINRIRTAVAGLGLDAAVAALGLVAFTVAVGLLAVALDLLAPMMTTAAAAINRLAGAINNLVDALRNAGDLIGDLLRFIGISSFSASVALNAAGPGDLGIGAVGGATGPTGSRPMIWIENFHATPAQSPGEIAAELDWISRGGG